MVHLNKKKLRISADSVLQTVFFFLLMFLNELKDIHSGDMLIAVCTLKPRGYLCL